MMLIVLIFIVIGLSSIHCCSIPHRVNPSRLCKHKGCMERPIFYNEGKRAQYAVDHKAENMVDVLSPTCKHKGCKKLSIFGYEGGKPEYCSEHKPDDMVDVRY